MSSLYIDRKGVDLRLDGQALAFYENNERIGTVPLAPIDRIYMRGDVTVNSSLLGKLGQLGIGVVMLSGRKSEVSYLMPCPHNDASRRVTQYKLSLNNEFSLSFAKKIVSLKLKEQQALLLELKEIKPKSSYQLFSAARQMQGSIEAVNEQDNIASLRGVEGSGASAYFSGLEAYFPESLKFSGRNRRPPRDPVNAALSLGYTLLHAETVRSLYGAGLDPFVGFYHQLHFGRESLACDFVELLRTTYDRFVVDLFRTRGLRVEDFSDTSTGCFMGKAARVRFYSLFEDISEEVRKILQEHIRQLVNDISTHQDAQPLEIDPEDQYIFGPEMEEDE